MAASDWSESGPTTYLNLLGPGGRLKEDPGGGLRDEVDVDELRLLGGPHLEHHVLWPIQAEH